MAKKKNVALFGGSFNPPHIGHLEIVKRVAKRKSIDEVWILPVWRHPFRKKLPGFSKRLRACRHFFLPPLKVSLPCWIGQGVGTGGCYEKIKIKSHEKHAGATGRTIDLLKYLTQKFPSCRFFWVMGSDTYKQRKRWKDFNGIKKMARLIIFPRGPRSPIPNIASREMRKGTGVE
ncbi:MAG: nicotinate-nicotinamide nucleotide adenylyltransferase [Deltaproteobacteria bacterium]|nr:nicotinate-nicotinamide nucleotide adenylyltransferase [Deltaproteobacteria bacterium]MBI2500669.1 nicotinate-nicotinamide nucleotide adenylyltransferase [Deltaproteobacteria bacterium]